MYNLGMEGIALEEEEGGQREAFNGRAVLPLVLLLASVLALCCEKRVLVNPRSHMIHLLLLLLRALVRMLVYLVIYDSG